MAAVPIPSNIANAKAGNGLTRSGSNDWVLAAATGTLFAGGVLMLAGKRRAAMIAAVTGAALAVLDQRETINEWWKHVPGAIDQAGRFIGQVEVVVEDLAVQRARLRTLFHRES
jgi:hypothetical protein